MSAVEEHWSIGFSRRLNRAALSHPRTGLRLAGLAGAGLGGRLGHAWAPTATELRELLDTADGRTVARLQRSIASRELRNRALMYVLRRGGPERILSLVQVQGADAFRRLRDRGRPALVAFWHLGVARSIEAALTGLGYSVLGASIEPLARALPGFRRLPVSDAASGTRFLMEARRELRSGGVVVLAADAAGGESRRTPFLARSLPLPSGITTLARMSGARVVPATSRWVGTSGAIEVTLHEPLAEPGADCSPLEWELELATGVMRWFERHVRSHPEDLRPDNIRRCLHPATAVEHPAP